MGQGHWAAIRPGFDLRWSKPNEADIFFAKFRGAASFQQCLVRDLRAGPRGIWRFPPWPSKITSPSRSPSQRDAFDKGQRFAVPSVMWVSVVERMEAMAMTSTFRPREVRSFSWPDQSECQGPFFKSLMAALMQMIGLGRSKGDAVDALCQAAPIAMNFVLDDNN